jgi:CRP-like cAMP-binding protein
LPLPTLERLANNLQSLDVDAGVAVITEGDEGDLFYLIAEGQVQVTRRGRDLATLGPGDGFGEIALLRDVPRTATVTTLEPTRLLALDRDDFLTAITGTSGAVSAADAMVDERRRTHEE